MSRTETRLILKALGMILAVMLWKSSTLAPLMRRNIAGILEEIKQEVKAA